MFTYLSSVAVEPTNDCNMNCSYCFAKNRPVGYMSIILFKEIVSQIPRHCRLTLSMGGESGLHPKFREMVYIAKNRRFREINVYSNGTMDSVYRGIKIIKKPKPPPKFVYDENFNIIENKCDAKPKYKQCRSLYRTMVVLWNGDAVLCCHDLAGKRVIGNLRFNSLRDIWNNKEYKRLRKVGHCEDCEIYKYTGY